MPRNLFAEPQFHDETAARVWFEKARWPEGPFCPKCGSLDPYTNKAKAGVYRCRAKECRKDFTVTTGSVMERTHLKLSQWAMGFWLAASSKKGFSAHQLHRAIGCEYNSAWFMFHCIREAMREGGLVPPLGGEHIIAEGLGGDLEIPQASCLRCERETGALVEGDVLGVTLKAMRVFLKIKTKHNKPPPATLPILDSTSGKDVKREIDTADYPVTFYMIEYVPPPFYQGRGGGLPPARSALFVQMSHNQRALREKYGITSFASARWDNVMLCRMLAKIAHAFAVAELGKNGFEPVLNKLIYDGNDLDPVKFIGGMGISKPSGALHELAIGYRRVRGINYVVVTIRLFANFASPIYQVVVGRSLESRIARARRVFSRRISLMLER